MITNLPSLVLPKSNNLTNQTPKNLSLKYIITKNRTDVRCKKQLTLKQKTLYQHKAIRSFVIEKQASLSQSNRKKERQNIQKFKQTTSLYKANTYYHPITKHKEHSNRKMVEETQEVEQSNGEKLPQTLPDKSNESTLTKDESTIKSDKQNSETLEKLR